MAKGKSSKESVKTLPPIKSLFIDSWELLRSVIGPFIVFNVVALLAIFVAVIIMIVGIILIGVGGIGLTNYMNINPLALGFGGITFGIIAFIIIAIISSIAQIGAIIILYDANPKINVFSVIRRSGKYIIPMILTGLVTGFLTLGGIFLFVIPAIIFSLFLTFSYYSIVAENKGPIASIKRSIYLVKNNFTGFLLRALALWGILFLINIVFSIILGEAAENSGNDGFILVSSIISIVVQILASWYSIAYSVVLFKQLKKVSGEGESSLKVITILSLVGWIIAIILGYIIIRAIPTFIELIQENNQDFEDQLTPEERKELEEIFKEIDSDFNIEDIDKYMQDSTNSPEIETSTQPAETI